MTDDAARLKRLKIRSWRRGTREMDLILGAFFDRFGSELAPDDLDLYETLLGENDHDLYAWVSEKSVTPERFEPLVERIRASRSAA